MYERYCVRGEMYASLRARYITIVARALAQRNDTGR